MSTSTATGTITQVIGAVVDCHFPEGTLPPIYSALRTKIGEHTVTLEVQQHLDGSIVRTVAMDSTDGLRRGSAVSDTGGPISVPVGPESLGRMTNVLGEPIDGMAEIKSKRFDQLTTKDSVTGWSVLGTDAGETAGSKSTFNDVDDYNGLSETLASPFTGFTRTTSVVYVAAADLATVSASRLNDYKRVTVQVSSGGTTYAQLITIVSAAVTQTA